MVSRPTFVGNCVDISAAIVNACTINVLHIIAAVVLLSIEVLVNCSNFRLCYAELRCRI